MDERKDEKWDVWTVEKVEERENALTRLAARPVVLLGKLLSNDMADAREGYLRFAHCVAELSVVCSF
jgi:hypothetical protein